MQSKRSAVVLLSGGQDSTTCLFLAKQAGYEIYPLTLSYNQRHSAEMKYAELNAKKVTEHPVKVVDLSAVLGTVSTSFLTDLSQTEITTNEKGLPSTYTPNRNALFLTVAHAYAQQVGAEVIYTGVCQTDYSGYPDCRKAFVDAIQDALNLGSECAITIRTPLMFLTKAQTFALALENGCLMDILHDTMTCYNGDEKANEWGMGCGTCPACELREKGYNEFVAKGHPTRKG